MKHNALLNSFTPPFLSRGNLAGVTCHHQYFTQVPSAAGTYGLTMQVRKRREKGELDLHPLPPCLLWCSYAVHSLASPTGQLHLENYACMCECLHMSRSHVHIQHGWLRWAPCPAWTRRAMEESTQQSGAEAGLPQTLLAQGQSQCPVMVTPQGQRH